MFPRSWSILLFLLIFFSVPTGKAASRFCPALPSPGPGETVVTLAPGDNLVSRIGGATAGTTFLLRDGTYQGGIEVNADRITIRSLSGNREGVIIQGGANNISINGDDCTIADLTLRRPDNWHNIQVRGEFGVLRTKIYNIHMIDAVQQFVKGSTANQVGADDGLVACSLIEYTNTAIGSYTNGVDILGGIGWIIRDNTFRRIRGPAAAPASGPAVLMWRNSQNTIVRRNLFVDCWRGIALGLDAPDQNSRGGPGVVYDHQNGVVENNVILGLNEPMDSAIENNYALNSKVFNNTVFRARPAGFSIEYRFAGTTVTLTNNLIDKNTVNRSPGAALGSENGNLVIVAASWFKNVLAEDFHLTDNSPAINRGVSLPALVEDFDGDARPQGILPDPGADEFGASNPANGPPAAPRNLRTS